MCLSLSGLLGLSMTTANRRLLDGDADAIDLDSVSETTKPLLLFAYLSFFPSFVCRLFVEELIISAE